MVELLATGHTWSGGGGPITWTPLAGLLLTLVLARSVLKLRLSPLILGTSVLLGTLFAIGAETWGVTMTISAWIVGALIVSGRIDIHSGVTPQIDSGAGLGLNTFRWARVRGQGGGS